MYLNYYNRVNIFARFTTGRYSKVLQEARQLNGEIYIPGLLFINATALFEPWGF
jgi:hypothetical protein